MMARLRMSKTGAAGRTRLTRRIMAGLATVAVGAALSATALGAFATSQRVCTDACHAMTPYAAASAESPHAALPCIRCHRTQGAFGSFADGWALQRRMAAAIVGRRPVAQALSDASCRECHAALLVDPVVSRGIAVRHADFEGERCTLCHAGTGHAVAGRRYDVAQMDDCMSCHSSSGHDLGSCDVCHVPDAERERSEGASTWRITHGSEWRTTHGMGDLRMCVSCHAPAYCARCHGLALPHPPTWPRQHGQAARTVGAPTCATCHERSWCDGCHGIEMPHRTDFLPRHGPDARRTGEQVCKRCHPEAACAECHLRSAHPNVPGVVEGHTGPTGRDSR